MPLPEELLSRYGGEALSVLGRVQSDSGGNSENLKNPDPLGFPYLSAQLRHSIHSEMVIHLEDFYLRRVPLYASRKDHGLPWLNLLAQVFAEERGLTELETQQEMKRLQRTLAQRSSWQKGMHLESNVEC